MLATNRHDMVSERKRSGPGSCRSALAALAIH
jgi:hypothetical protein